MARTTKSIDSADQIVAALERADKAAEEMVRSLTEAVTAIKMSEDSDHTTAEYVYGVITDSSCARRALISELEKWKSIRAELKLN